MTITTSSPDTRSGDSSSSQEPAATYWGPQTAEAIASFDVHGVRLWSAPALVVALAAVKEAAARANLRSGRSSGPVATAIGAACREVVDGRWRDQFVVDISFGGSPRQVQANADEVLARRAQELARGGVSVAVDDLRAEVDLHPVSLRLAAILAARDLLEDLRRLQGELRRRAAALAASTLDDAVLLSLRRRLDGYAHDIAAQELHLEETLIALHDVPVRVTDPSPQDFATVLAEELSFTTGMAFAVDAETPARSGGTLLVLHRSLKPLAVRLAQVWSGLSTLADAAGMPALDGRRSRSEVVNRTALDVIGAVLLDEVRHADRPDSRAESAITVSVLTSLNKLAEAIGAVADWCQEGLDTPQASLAA